MDFDPRSHLSPYRLFRWLREGRSLTLLDLRPPPVPLTLAGARPFGHLQDLLADGLVEGDGLLVLFDDDGTSAAAALEELPMQLRSGARILFGGLELYDYCLDPQVVGDERYLRDPEELNDC